MSKIDITSQEWNDLVFEGRNKEYGGYFLRRTSDKRHILALIIVCVVAILIFYSPKIFKILMPVGERIETVNIETEMADLDQPEDKPEDKPEEIEIKQLPELRKTIVFTEITAVKEDIKEVISNEEIFKDDAAISDTKQEGTTNVEIPLEIHNVGPKEDTKEYQIFEVEQKPDFPGGMEALYKFIGKNLRYPPAMQENGIQGRVVVEFLVSKSGKVVNIKVIKGLDPAGDKEAIRVVESMPNWNPGKNNGVPVQVLYQLPINYKLQ